MNSLLDDTLLNIKNLNLTYIDESHTLNIVKIAFNYTSNFINLNFNPIFDFNLIYHLIIDITIGEYLTIIKNSNLQSFISLDNCVKTINEGDVSITYFETQSNEKKLDLLIEHFLGKKKELLSFKTITW